MIRIKWNLQQMSFIYKMLCKTVKFQSHCACVAVAAPSELMLKVYKLRAIKDVENSSWLILRGEHIVRPKNISRQKKAKF